MTEPQINVAGMPEFDALLDHIYEYGTASEGIIDRANAFARALLARYGKPAASAEPVACLRRQRNGSGWTQWQPGTVDDGQRVTGLRSWQVRWLTDAPVAAQAPAKDADDGWRIDHTAGRPILVYQNCSVIEAEQAEYVLRLIEADRQQRGGDCVIAECWKVLHEAGLDRQHFDGPLPDAIRAALAAQKADDARDAARWREVERRATKKTAYDRYGNGAYWSVGVFSGDSRQTFGETIDAAIDAARQGEGGAE